MLVAIKKCEFFTRKIDFIRFIIKLGYISIDLKKVEAIVSQQELENVIQLRLFLGFCNYYKRFIIQQLKNIEPFIRLIKKEELQVQGSKQERLFRKLKRLFTQDLILKIYQVGLNMVVETDVLDFTLGVYLLQKYQDAQHLVAYYSRKIILLELNYNIYNKELLGIVTVLKEQRAFL